MDTVERWRVAIPAPAPAKIASRLLTAGLLGVVTGNINHGLLAAGESVPLNEKINVPSVCNLCGTNAGTKHSAATQDVAFSDLGAMLGGSLLGKAKVEFRVPLCDGCARLPAAPGVSLQSYGKRGDHWEVTLLIVNRAVASLYAEANPGSAVSVSVSAPVAATDGRRSARVVNVPLGWAVAVNGVIGNRYDAILKDSLALSPDGHRVAYGAKTKGKWTLVVDGIEGKRYDGLLNMAPMVTFSPDGRRTAYGARVGHTTTIVVDGSENCTYDGVQPGSLAFSPDSRRVAYIAKTGGKWMVVVDGSPGGAYDSVLKNSVAFSPDGARVAFGALTAGRWTVVVDGIEGTAYDGLAADPVAFSPDGRRVAFGALTGGKLTVVVDGVKGADYDGLGQDSIAFSPDGARVAFGARTGGSWTVVVDGVEGRPYDGILALKPMIVFSRDGRRVAYGANIAGDKVTVVVDGVEEGPCEAIARGSLAFSPDGEHISYRARIRGQAAGEWTSIVAAALTSVRETEPAAPATPGPVAQQAITGSAQPQWAVEWPWTHLVPAGGIPAWAAPDPSRPPVVNLAERLRLVIGQRAGDWALVRAQNGWSGWVDGRRLVPRP
jgi:hypothetical protein